MRYAMVVAIVLVLSAFGSAAGAGTETRQAVTAIKAPLPPNAGSHYDYYLTQIACASQLDCAATGLLSTSPTADHGVLLLEKAGKWTVGEPSLPGQTKRRGNSSIVPGDVSCSAVGRCVAVAWAYTDVQEEALIFTQRKTGWRETVLPRSPRRKGGPRSSRVRRRVTAPRQERSRGYIGSGRRAVQGGLIVLRASP